MTQERHVQPELRDSSLEPVEARLDPDRKPFGAVGRETGRDPRTGRFLPGNRAAPAPLRRAERSSQPPAGWQHVTRRRFPTFSRPLVEEATPLFSCGRGPEQRHRRTRN